MAAACQRSWWARLARILYLGDAQLGVGLDSPPPKQKPYMPILGLELGRAAVVIAWPPNFVFLAWPTQPSISAGKAHHHCATPTDVGLDRPSAAHRRHQNHPTQLAARASRGGSPSPALPGLCSTAPTDDGEGGE
jgi:hypothetical protein